MAPKRFSSAPHKSRPSPRVPFRDDSGLVAFRYEQTVQAEPPIPIIPVPQRNPTRAAGRYNNNNNNGSNNGSNSGSNNGSNNGSNSGSNSPVNRGDSPVVIVPPPIAPAIEQHPALRSRSAAEEWKRDSGLAPTPSTVTGEDGTAGRQTGTAAPSLVSSDLTELAGVLRFTIDSHADTIDTVVALDSSWEDPRPALPSPSLAREASRRLTKSFSFGSYSSGRRLWKKSTGDGDDVECGRMTPIQSPTNKLKKMGAPGSRAASPTTFEPIATTIPSEQLIDDDVLTSLSFSRRGSIMFGGKRAFALVPSAMEGKGAEISAPPSLPRGDATLTQTTTATTTATDVTTDGDAPEAPTSKAAPVPSIRVTSLDVEKESQKVRSLYESGSDVVDWEEGGPVASSLGDRLEPTVEAPWSDEEENVAYGSP